MNIYVPFICLAFGAVINWKGLSPMALRLIDIIMNIALMVLMLVIGMNIGSSEQVMSNLGSIGLNCVLISMTAVWGSVALVVLCEKTVMPLEKIKKQVMAEKDNLGEAFADKAALDEASPIPPKTKKEKHSGFSPLILVMPGFIILGILIGFFALNGCMNAWLVPALTISLIFLYTGVGVSLASNKSVFGYIKRLGFRILFMSAAIFIGCLIGGLISGLILGVPLSWSILAASGMGYYSLGGAFMTETYGIVAGTYGFIVNVIRDVLTVILLPILIKISKGSPIASGAAGCMDTMLVPVSRFVGPELSLVALITGTILTFVVPVWLPIGAKLLSAIQ